MRTVPPAVTLQELKDATAADETLKRLAPGWKRCHSVPTDQTGAVSIK